MAWWTWGKWPDVLIDFGRELYVPWRLTQGDVLYRDIAVFNGPLSAYANALAFRLFGVGVWTLVACNLAVVCGVLALLYALVRQMAGRAAATSGCLAFVALFGFGQVVRTGNYNWVCPYAHELSHGIALSLLSIYLLVQYGRRGALWAAAGAGLALGLVVLTKAEVSLAAALAVPTGLGLLLWAERPSRGRIAAVLGVFVAGVVVPPLVACGLLATAMPVGQAVRGTLGTWAYVVEGLARGEFGGQVFYRWQMGTLDLGASLGRLAAWSGGYAVVAVVGCVLAMALGRVRRSRVWIVVVVFLATSWLALTLGVKWQQAAMPLPVVLLVLGGVWAVAFVRRPGERTGLAVRLAMAVFALALLAKMILNVRLYHYGFALAMPGTVLVVAAVVGWVPAWLTRRGACGAVFRAVAIALVMVVATRQLAACHDQLRFKTQQVGQGADAFLADARGRHVAATLAEIEQRVGEADTLAAFPEGVMLNYLGRRRCPTPFINFMPTEVVRFGEERMLSAFEAKPPKWVALVHKSTAEFGVPFFGRDYGKQLGAWLRAHYRPVWQAGAVPLDGYEFGIQLLERVREGE